jgi:hypothetical protein
MKLTDYIQKNEDFHLISKALDVGASRALLKAAMCKRNKSRKQAEDEPKRSDNLKEDIIYRLGFISGLTWILDLPGQANDYLKNLEGEET